MHASQQTHAAGSLPDRRTLVAAIAPFQEPSSRRSLWQFASTFLGFLAVNAAMYACLHVSVWLTLALAFPAAGLMVRLFIVQHDCGHGSFFRSRRHNDLLGRFCSAITFTPYAFWRRQHANHHACFNNLDRRDPGIDLYSSCATLQEYLALPRLRRLFYRVSRHPLVAQLLVPPFVFLVLYRVPFDAPASWTRERASVHLTNLTILGVLGALALLLGTWQVLLVQLSIVAITSVIGVWLFTVQHRFEDAQWMRQEQWSPVQASLAGSSYLKLPRVLQWFTGNIGFHHVHHLVARVPNYRLQECHDASPDLLGAVTTLTLRQALRAPSYALWDEDRELMVPFPRRARRGVGLPDGPVRSEDGLSERNRAKSMS
jgi:omega-6 fatty acid desaturase (delta-12 desaturase)